MTQAKVTPIVLDAEQTLCLDLGGVKLIEASAGTGKTYAISNLYLRYILDGFLVAQVLVVTFTNAATEELRGRIRIRLLAAQRALENINASAALSDDVFLGALLSQFRQGPEEAVNEALARLRFAVRSMDTAAIFTINGFCQRALTDHAFSSGQAFQLDLIRDDDELWSAALKDWWRRCVYTLSPDDLALFSSVFPTLSAFLSQQTVLRYARGKKIIPQSTASLEDLFAQASALREPLAALALRWHSEGAALKELLLSSSALGRNATSGYRLPELQAALVQIDRYFNDIDTQPLPKEFEILTLAHIVAGTKPKQLGKDPALENEFFSACQSVHACLVSIREQLHITALMQATAAAAAEIERQKSLSRTLSYQDQLTRLHDALCGQTGPALARVLRDEFPIAMIDEFQDTDALQYQIFRMLYLSEPSVESASASVARRALTMIGDPKQAIYSFRGGDIFAYATARRDVGAQLYTLDTNWRSVPKLVQAVNAVFQGRQAPFVYDEVIDFKPVHYAPKEYALLREDGHESTALTIWQFESGADGKAPSKSSVEAQACAAVADEVARLLIAGAAQQALLGDKAVQPNDIAILVRTASEGRKVRAALQGRGVNAVSVGRDTVFESEEASGLLALLQAVVHYRDRSVLRAALSSSLLTLNYVQIAALLDDQERSLEWALQMKALNEQWAQRGFMSMFYALLHGLDLGEKLASMGDAERRLTNLLHLGELLQHSSRTHSGLEALLSWYREQLSASDDEESEMRLESDEALVKIVTIHASKGLEYPIVFVPFLWACKPRGESQFDKKGFVFHDENGQACLALNKAAMDANEVRADKERLAEDIRLAYVALTRARAKLYLVWGAAASRAHGSATALAWLLHAKQAPEDLDTGKLAVKIDDASVAQALQDLLRAADGAIAYELLPASSAALHFHDRDLAAKTLGARIFNAQLATDWRINSFSSLSRGVHQPPMKRSEARNDDAIMSFPAGSHVGLFLHELLEHLDFQGDIEAQLIVLNKARAQRYGLSYAEHEATLVQWLQNIVKTPLSAQGLCLAQLANTQRLNELEFDFAIDQVRVARLQEVIEEWSGCKLAALSVEDFRGMITGVIDLVFVSGGRYYIADYKSNLLGTFLQDYEAPALRKAMFERRYDLQYLLYVLALHRYLRQRIPDYDYGQHMGGAYYLFLRGMRPEHGPRYGVYFDLPAQQLILELDERVFGFVCPSTQVYS